MLHQLKLSDLLLGLRDLFDKRLADLRLAKSGNFYEPMLAEQLSAIIALPRSLTSGTPAAAELDAVDRVHDGFGSAIYFTTEVYLRLPGASPDLVAAAERIRASFIPSLAELGASYALEAERAIERKPLLARMRDDLVRFPVAGEGTLLEVATKFLEAGEHLHRLLSERIDLPQSNRKATAALRSITIGLLTRLRSDLMLELDRMPDLPRDLEHRIFGYFDALARMRPRSTAPIGSWV